MCVVFCVSNQRPGRACVVVAANAKGGAYPVDAHRHASEGNLTELETQAHISISSHHRLIFIIVSSLGTPSVLPIIRQSGADGHRAASRREERRETARSDRGAANGPAFPCRRMHASRFASAGWRVGGCGGVGHEDDEASPVLSFPGALLLARLSMALRETCMYVCGRW